MYKSCTLHSNHVSEFQWSSQGFQTNYMYLYQSLIDSDTVVRTCLLVLASTLNRTGIHICHAVIVCLLCFTELYSMSCVSICCWPKSSSFNDESSFLSLKHHYRSPLSIPASNQSVILVILCTCWSVKTKFHQKVHLLSNVTGSHIWPI